MCTKLNLIIYGPYTPLHIRPYSVDRHQCCCDKRSTCDILFIKDPGQQNHSSCLDYVIEFRSAKFGNVHPNFVFKLGDKGCMQIFKAIKKLLEIILRSDGHTYVDQRGPAKLTGENILGKQQQKHRVCQTGIYFWFLNTI